MDARRFVVEYDDRAEERTVERVNGKRRWTSDGDASLYMFVVEGDPPQARLARGETIEFVA